MQHDVKLTIGDAARAAGVSAKAVRLWEAKGLLPVLARTNAGYRLFTPADVAVLQFIRQAKSLGLTLAEVRDILRQREAGTEPCARVIQLIDARIAEIDRSLAGLRQLRRALQAARHPASPRTRPRAEAAICRIIEGSSPTTCPPG